MIKRQEILRLVYEAIDEVNELLPSDRRLTKKEETKLFDKTGGQGLDSLGLINLMVATEQKLAENTGEQISLVYHLTSIENENPIATIGVFADYITIFFQDLSKKSA